MDTLSTQNALWRLSNMLEPHNDVHKLEIWLAGQPARGRTVEKTGAYARSVEVDERALCCRLVGGWSMAMAVKQEYVTSFHNLVRL